VQKYRKQSRSDKCFNLLKKRIEKELQHHTASHDFEVYSYYLYSLSTKFPQIWELNDTLLDFSINILVQFFYAMKEMDHTYDTKRDTTISDLVGFSSLLQEKNSEKLLEMMKVHQRPENRETIRFCVSPPVHSSPAFPLSLFSVLQTANLLILPLELQEYLELCVSGMEYGTYCEEKLKNQFARLMIIVFGFVNWSQSDHPHRHFIFDCISSMKETGTMKHADLARFLNLQKFQSKEFIEFHNLFKRYRKYAHSSIECSKPTERSLLCFFDLMHMILSNERFLRIIQEFRKTLEREIISLEPDSICHSFLEKLAKDDQFHPMIQGIRYFRRTNCAICKKFLDDNNDDGVCEVHKENCSSDTSSCCSDW